MFVAPLSLTRCIRPSDFSPHVGFLVMGSIPSIDIDPHLAVISSAILRRLLLYTLYVEYGPACEGPSPDELLALKCR